MNKWYLLTAVVALYAAKKIYQDKKRRLAATRSQPEVVENNPDINRGRLGDASLYDRTVPAKLL